MKQYLTITKYIEIGIWLAKNWYKIWEKTLRIIGDKILLKSQVGDTIVMLEVFGTRKKIKLDYAVKPTIKLDLKINVRFSDSTKDISGESLGRQATVPREYCAALEKELTKTLTDMTLRAYKKGVDLFDVRELTYRHYNKQFNDLKNLPLTSFVPQVDIKVSSKD